MHLQHVKLRFFARITEHALKHHRHITHEINRIVCTTTCHGTSSSSSPCVSFSLTGASTVDVDPFSSCTALTALMKNAITLSPQFKLLQLQEFCVERPAFFARSRHCDRRSRVNGATRGLRTSATPARKHFRIVGRCVERFPR